METATLKVEGMSCQHCVKAIEGALRDAHVEGSVNLEGHTVDVRFEPGESSLEKIGALIEDQGYDVVGHVEQ